MHAFEDMHIITVNDFGTLYIPKKFARFERDHVFKEIILSYCRRNYMIVNSKQRFSYLAGGYDFKSA